MEGGEPRATCKGCHCADDAAPRVDADAAFTKQGDKTVYGYKAHLAVDRGSGLIRRARLTPANVHDSQAADALVIGDERAVYADKAYASHARRAALKARGIKDRILHRPNKHHRELAHWQRRRNALISSARAPIERTFGTFKRSYGYRRVRYFSLLANAVELQLKCFAFNLRRAAVLASQPADLKVATPQRRGRWRQPDTQRPRSVSPVDRSGGFQLRRGLPPV